MSLGFGSRAVVHGAAEDETVVRRVPQSRIVKRVGKRVAGSPALLPDDGWMSANLHGGVVRRKACRIILQAPDPYDEQK